jgi:putative endonuclease
MFYVYILHCADGTYYVGSTNDIEKRLHSHNNLKSGAHYTKIRRPVELVYSKKCKTYSRVRELEGELKRLTRDEKTEVVKKCRSKK